MAEILDKAALTEGVFYILLSLHEPMHGYGIMQKTAALSGGRVSLAAGTLYGALNTLLDRGWIRALPIRALPGEKNSRKIEYEITQAGRAAAKAELVRLEELAENGRRILEGE